MGTEIGAALTTLDALRPDVIGLNCATGPREMSEHLRYLSQQCRVPISVPAQRRPAVGRRGPDALRPDAGPAGRAPRPVHHRVRGVGRRWLLRHHPGASGGGGGPLPGPGPDPAGSRSGARLRLDLHPRAVRPEPVVPGGGRADQRQRLQAVPGGHAGRRLGHLRRHGPGPGEGRRPRHRRVRRLHRRGRRGRHGRDRGPLRHPGDPAADARLDRAGRHRDRPAAHRRQAAPQLGQPGGRRRPRHPPRPSSCPWPGSTAPPWSAPASTRRARPAPPSGSCGRPGRSTTWPSTATGWSRPTCSSTPSSCRCRTGMEESRRDGIETIEGIRHDQGRPARCRAPSSACPTSPSG